MTVQVIDTNREVSTAGASRPGFRARRVQARRDMERARLLASRWSEVTLGLGLGVNPGAASTTQTPQVVAVHLDPPRLMVRLRPWQSISHLAEHSAAIARALGVHSVRLVDRHGRYVRVELLSVDPLAMPVSVPAGLVDDSVVLMLGMTEDGRHLWTTLREQAHLIVQGQTRSGKSRWSYSILAQVAAAPGLVIAGTDITSLLLRPFVGTRHAQWQATGSDVHGHLLLLGRLVAEMERRLRLMPADQDVLPTSQDVPLMLVVIEEYPGLLEAAAALDAISGSKSKIVAQIRSAVGRLLAESAKVGMRVMLITQRAEASIIGGFHRGQAPLRVSFRVEDVESVRMLHPTCTDEDAATHTRTVPGRALVTGVGLPLSRLRAPEMPSYAHYADQVATACRTASA